MEKIERVNNDIESNWWNYEIYIKRKIDEYEEIKDKEKFKQSVALIQKIQKNIIDNPSDDKYRTIKQQNPKIKEVITKYFNGLQFLKIIGF